ncbi:MAG: septum site-determining protein MinD [Defluviitaleaceae bacterium]|nr:septum site-determining protein MinD [Defluviitaleaceae bacterium]
MAEIIVVTSGKGGVGKTTTTANIGVALAAAGKSVVLIDADIGLRNLDVVMGLENRIVYDLVQVVEGVCRVKQALIKDKRYENLHLLAAAQTKDKGAVSPEQMVKLVGSLADDYDYIVIDCPAGIEQGFQNAIAAAQRAIVVATPEVSSVRDADRIVGLLEAANIKDIRLVLNRIRPELTKRGEMLTLSDVTDVLAIDVLGVVPDDESIVTTTNRGEVAVAEAGSKAGAAFRNVAARIVDENVAMLEITSDEKFIDKIRKIFKKS